MAQKTGVLAGRAHKATGVLASLAILSLTFSIFTPSPQAQAAGCPTPTAPTEGDGSSDAPYVIDSAAKLAWIGEPVGSSDADRVKPTDSSTAFKQHADRLAAHYIQDGQIDLSGCDWAPIGFVWNDGSFTDGVPNRYAGPFSGTYDGQDNLISGLNVDIPAGFLMQSGLFGSVGSANSGSPAVIKNLVIANADVRSLSTNNAISPTGILAGIFGVPGSNFDFGFAQAENVHVSGSASMASAGQRLGGLVGLAGGDALIIGSSSTAAVSRVRNDTSNVQNRTGGLIGELETNATVLRSYATGRVITGNNDGNGATGQDVGGLVGLSSGKVLYSYATGNVVGYDDTGGLVGRLSSDNQEIKNSYSLGDVALGVTNKNSLGGLVGRLRPTASSNIIHNSLSAGSVTKPGDLERVGAWAGGRISDPVPALDAYQNIEDSFYDSTKDIPALAIANSTPSESADRIVRGLTSSEISSFSTFDAAGWAIVAGWAPFNAPDDGDAVQGTHQVWGICSGVNGGYPFLLWQFDSDPCVPSATVATPREKRSSDAGIHLDFQASVGGLVAVSSVVIGGQGLSGGSQYSLVVRSTPQTLTSGTASALGNFSGRVSMPALSPGSHTLTLTATALDGSTLTLVQSFTVAANGTISAIGAPTGSQTGGLAATGVNGLPGGLGLAGLALLLGVAMVLSARRYQHTD